MMKRNGYHLYRSIPIILLIFCSGNLLYGQEKWNLAAGVGVPELIHMDVRYQLAQGQVSLGIGSFPVREEGILSVTGDVYLHFAGSSEWSVRRPWFGRIGLDYLRDETVAMVDQYLYLNLRAGRDINLSRKFGLGVDAGVMFQLFNDTMRKEPASGWELDLDFPVLPGVGICLFYRL